MHAIVPIAGNVKFQITLDPSVWIFDDRKIEKDVFLNPELNVDNEEDAQEKNKDQMGIREGVVRPPVNRSIKRFEKEKILQGSFVIPLRPFLVNAEPNHQATKVKLEDDKGNGVEISIDEAFEGMLGFAENGKPLKEDGPVHFYLGDTSNKDNPIKNIHKIVVI